MWYALLKQSRIRLQTLCKKKCDNSDNAVESLLDTAVSDNLICVTKQFTEADVLLKI